MLIVGQAQSQMSETSIPWSSRILQLYYSYTTVICPLLSRKNQEPVRSTRTSSINSELIPANLVASSTRAGPLILSFSSDLDRYSL